MNRSFAHVLGLGCCAALASSASAAPTVQRPTLVRPADRGISPPLSLIAPAPRFVRAEHEPLPIPHPPYPLHADPVVQTNLPFPAIPTPSLTFQGVGNGFTGPQGTYNVALAPPDTNGDVGKNQYIQIVNTDFAIFSKTGTTLYGPVQVNTVFQGFTGGQGLCASTNDGDPVVLYDQAADRWFITQFGFTFPGGVPQPPYYQCVAVSKTNDPMGQWYQYAFGPYQQSGTDALNDYGKFGVWPDAYYATYNIFGDGAAMLCAFDRNSMLSGAAATEQCVQLALPYSGVLPVDIDGATAPPAGEPGMFLGFDGNGSALDFWTYHVDWTTPANTVLNGPTQITVSPFTPACGRTCVPQPTGQTLDVLGDRMMFRASYRNFGDHEVLLANHSVNPGTGLIGVRWYELHNATGSNLGNATPTVFQQGTYAPSDGQYRWMGSVAMDQSQNIALGFSIGNSSSNASINYTAHLVGDPAGTMGQGEGTFKTGTGAQNGGLSRWGDYSNMTIDPSDDCTFWYTQEYIPTNGADNWDTFVGTFKLPNCPPISKVVMSGLPTTATAGTAVTFTLTAIAVGGGTATTFNGSVILTSSDPQASFASSVSFTNGIANNVPITFKTAGTQTVTATPPGLPSAAATGTTQVSAGATAGYVLSGLPATTVAATATPFNIQAVDAFGNPTPGYGGHATISTTDARAVIPGPVTFSGGVANNVSITLKTAGTQAVTATDSSNASITGQASVVVTIGPLAIMTVTGLAATATAGTATPFNVLATDLGGNQVTSYSGTVAITSSDSAAVLPANMVLAGGIGSGSQITLKTAGSQKVIATDITNATLTGNASTTVSAASAVSYKMTGLAAQVKQGTATTFTVTAFDTFGNVATGYIGPATVKSSDLQATLPSSQAFSKGVASNISVTFNNKGTQTVTVTDAFQSTMTATGSTSVQSNSPFAFCGCGAETAGVDALGLFSLLAGLWMRRRGVRPHPGPLPRAGEG